MKNWYTRIIEARKRGEFTRGDRALVGHWVTCACGEQDDRIFRSPSGAPMDMDLSYWGLKFSEAVCDNLFVEAEKLLRSIEHRAGIIIKELQEAT